ncbi:MAG: DNA primase [Thermoplasmata archaeon]|nr:DNA primase [Thermoplasmata archaeon]
MNIDPTTTKYLIHSKINAEGVIEKPDVIGAIFGQTEGLLGDELDLRDLQKSGRMGRIEVDVDSKKGKSLGKVVIPSSLDQVETAILAAALETIERVGPCKAGFEVENIEDVRLSKRLLIIDRAKELLKSIIASTNSAGVDLTDSVRRAVQVDEIVSWGKYNNPAGPNVETSDAIIIVEGRNDILNLLKYGIKNTIAVEGTNINDDIKKLTRERIVTAFVDGDRGGELIIKELLQVGELDFVARAPPHTEVEELTQKQVMKALRNKLPMEQYIEMYDIKLDTTEKEEPKKIKEPKNITRSKSTQYRPSYPQRPAPRPQPRARAEPRKERTLSPRLQDIKAKIDNLLKERKGLFLGPDGGIIKEVQVGELADDLKTVKEPVESVVFGGFITQRLVDIASEKGIKTLAGLKESNVSKRPENLEIITKADLG